ISITDRQIALNARQFELGQLPAVDTGLSVSRRGGKTQAPLMRAAVAQLRLAYAQFLELEGFSRFGTELDARVQAQIARGRLIRTALGQPQLAPQNPALQVALMIALQAGLLDAGGPQALPAKLTQLGAAIDADPALAAALRTRGKVPPGLQERLRTQLAQVLGELPTAVI
ncbi:MAG: F0F1 ATP synthase subunit alpha, partial [Burkholderiaceae bacterium]|nr:F0F1 ATP synthase subunit alpha [Burkholderiaceae bacterium]